MRPLILINHLLEPPDRISGVSSYLFALLAALLKRNDYRYLLATCWSPEALPQELRSSGLQVRQCPHVASMPLNVLRQMRLVRMLMRESGASLELNTNPVGCFRRSWPRVIVVHDLYFDVMPDRYK